MLVLPAEEHSYNKNTHKHYANNTQLVAMQSADFLFDHILLFSSVLLFPTSWPVFRCLPLLSLCFAAKSE